MKYDGEARLRALCASENLDAIALVPGSNFRKVYDQDFHQNERALVVVVRASGPSAAVVPALEAASFDMIAFEGEVFHWRDNDGTKEAFAALGRALAGVQRIGVEGQRMRVMEHHGLKDALPGLEIVDAHRAISNTLRLHKSANDLALLKRAIEISEAALEATLGEVAVGQSETEIESILLKNLFSAGADGIAFEPIVAAADNSYRPHAKARESYRIKAGDALLLDFGGTYRGYRADITRTFFVRKADERARAQYETVLAANAAGRAATRPGVSCGALDDIVLKVLEASPFAAYVRTKTGHGLGLDVHEDPYIMRGNDQALEPGMVFTIEPGLYVPDLCGVRIEDDVVVTAHGMESLTTFPRDLRLVG